MGRFARYGRGLLTTAAILAALSPCHVSAQEGNGSSKLDTAMAKYERRFQKPFPAYFVSGCSESEKISLIEQAINARVAVPAKEEDAMIKERLAAEYQKRTAPTKFELTAARVNFWADDGTRSGTNPKSLEISITRTATGAIVENEIQRREILEIELSMKEWVDIMSDLRRYRVDEWALWEKKAADSLRKLHGEDYFIEYGNPLSGQGWSIEIISLDMNARCAGNINKLKVSNVASDRYGIFPPNWFLVKRHIMDRIAAKTLKKAVPPCLPVTAVYRGAFKDKRDGKKYKTVKLGTQTWMAENLNYRTDSSWCYDNMESNCLKYGRLYAWNAATAACPSGWHLPSRQEWDCLGDAVGGVRKTEYQYNGIYWDKAGEKLKAKYGWEDKGYGRGRNGTDDYGFCALPGGTRFNNGNFSFIDTSGIWWSAKDGAYSRSLSNHSDCFYDDYSQKSSGHSVRCVMDDKNDINSP